MIRKGDLANHAIEPGSLTIRPAAGGRGAGPVQAKAQPVVNLETSTDPIFTCAELAAYWKVSLRTVYREVNKRALPAYRLPGGAIRVRRSDAIAYGRPLE